MKPSLVALLSALVVVLLAAPALHARPPHRQKRVSDQRLGELEALLALKKLRGKLVTVPVAFGQINPNDYGRRRRSAPHQAPGRLLLERLLEAQDELLNPADLYDELPLEAGDVPNQPRWTENAYERERSAPAYSRPVAE